MIGISEESLRKETIIAKDMGFDLYAAACVKLLARCKELNPWQQIDENTPKDRPIIVFWEDGVKGIHYWTSEHGFDYFDKRNVFKVKATHWQELPDDPK